MEKVEVGDRGPLSCSMAEEKGWLRTGSGEEQEAGGDRLLTTISCMKWKARVDIRGERKDTGETEERSD